MKKALVCGAGGFFGGHLVKKLQREGYWVQGIYMLMHYDLEGPWNGGS